MNRNEEMRFGSARFATEGEIDAAGLFNQTGLQIGFFDERPLYYSGDAPMTLFGGAGSGKHRDILGHVLSQPQHAAGMVLDLKGELAATSIIAFAPLGLRMFTWNPSGIAGLPKVRLNPIDMLNRNSASVHADCRMLAESLIPFSGGGESRYFEQRAREWVGAFLLFLTEWHGRVTLVELSDLLNMIEGDTEEWLKVLDVMTQSEHVNVRRASGEILAKQSESQREFGAILGTIYGCLSILDDPMLRASLRDPQYDFADFVAEGNAYIFLTVPAEYVAMWSPILRCFFTAVMIHKARQQGSGRITFIIDEAAQLGRFDGMKRLYTYGRGLGIRTWGVFQDIGQITANYGLSGVQTFIGSSACRQFIGIRDYETAQMISDMLGSETLTYIDPLLQTRARHAKADAVMRILNGDPITAAWDYKRFQFEATHRPKQARKLMTPDEILTMGEDRQLILLAGMNLPPIFAHKRPYYTAQSLAGRYLPNPYHPPSDSVIVQTAHGAERRRIITEPVPPELAHLVQYSGGRWSYVDGYRPSLGRKFRNGF
jgi:type IV secretion system protein VirD4